MQNFFNGTRSYTIPNNLTDVVDTFKIYAVQPKDACLKTNDETDKWNYHTTMDIDVYWNACDSIMELSWTPYKGFNVGNRVEYDIVWDTSATLTNPIDNNDWTSNLSYKFKVEKNMPVGTTGLLMTFYVKARPAGPGAISNYVSHSNRASETALYEDTPRYTYQHYSSVIQPNTVEVQVYPDTSVWSNIRQFIIYRGLAKSEMEVIGSVDKFNVLDSTFRYYDNTASTDEFSYFYRVVVENTCGGPVDTSNFGRTILLDVESDPEALTNTLKWNEYQEWDSTVAYYNIYRSFNSGIYLPHEVVAPSSSDQNLFVDDVYDEIFAIGDFCYLVEAVQGPVTTDFDINQELDPAYSRSNRVCVTMEPLFYIPNAFSPGGLNSMFRPEGQFF